jgi:hypothetical protein
VFNTHNKSGTLPYSTRAAIRYTTQDRQTSLARAANTSKHNNSLQQANRVNKSGKQTALARAANRFSKSGKQV